LSIQKQVLFRPEHFSSLLNVRLVLYTLYVMDGCQSWLGFPPGSALLATIEGLISQPMLALLQ